MEKYYLFFDFEFPKEQIEEYETLLFEIGCIGIEEIKTDNKTVSRAYFEDKPDIPETLKKYLLNSQKLKEENWNENWKKYFKPVEIGEKIVVVPSWMKDEYKLENRIPIYIYPGQTFGTGTHETTKLMIKLLEKYVKPECSLLDVGCGSGILSITAKKLGAGKVVACDIQKECKEEIKLNANLNNLQEKDIIFIQGSVTEIDGKFDIVVSNIEKHLLEPLIGNIVERSKNLILLSGILETQKDEFLKTLKKFNLKVNEIEKDKEWIAFACTKN